MTDRPEGVAMNPVTITFESPTRQGALITWWLPLSEPVPAGWTDPGVNRDGFRVIYRIQEPPVASAPEG